MERVLRMMKVLNGHNSERKSILKALCYSFKDLIWSELYSFGTAILYNMDSNGAQKTLIMALLKQLRYTYAMDMDMYRPPPLFPF